MLTSEYPSLGAVSMTSKIGRLTAMFSSRTSRVLPQKAHVTDAASLPRWGSVPEEQCTGDHTRLFACRPELNQKVALWQGDMTKLKVGAIVNAANSSLLGGGGIDGAIHRAAGRKLLDECRKLRGCETGNTKVTRGYDLPAARILHTVGPIGENPEMLASCYRTILEQAVAHEIRSICCCCVSTGIYGYPPHKAARVALTTVREWLESEENAANIDLVVFCTFLDSDLEIYKRLLPVFFPRVDRSEPSAANGGEETKQSAAAADNPEDGTAGTEPARMEITQSVSDGNVEPTVGSDQHDEAAGAPESEAADNAQDGGAMSMEISDAPEQKRPRSDAGETTSQDDEAHRTSESGVVEPPNEQAAEAATETATATAAATATASDENHEGPAPTTGDERREEESSPQAHQPGGEVTGQAQQADGELTKEG